VIRAANRAVRLRSAADAVTDIKRPPPLSAYPRARAVLEAHADSVWGRLTSVSEQTWGPISDELVLAFRADFTGDEAAVNAALALVTVAANLGLTYPSPTTAAAGPELMPARRTTAIPSPMGGQIEPATYRLD
jgi:hypothetical protein